MLRFLDFCHLVIDLTFFLINCKWLEGKTGVEYHSLLCSPLRSIILVSQVMLALVVCQSFQAAVFGFCLIYI